MQVVTASVMDLNGMLAETYVKSISGLVERAWTSSKYIWSEDPDRHLLAIETMNDSGLTKAAEFKYDDPYGNQTQVWECGYSTPGTRCTQAAALRRTETTYETGSGWINRNLLSLPKEVKVFSGATIVSKTTFTYDEYEAQTLSGVMQHDPRFEPSHPQYVAYRGNMTKVVEFENPLLLENDPKHHKTEMNYDITGNVVSTHASCCNVKTLTYDAANGYAYPVSETRGSSPTQLTTTATYNRNTGRMLSSTNENGQQTTYEYETSTLRPTRTNMPNGGYAQMEYGDNDIAYTRHTTKLTASDTVQSYVYFDGRGNQFRNASQTPDGWLISATAYDHLGRARRSYNPFYGTTSTTEIPANTKYVDTLSIDALGRATEVKLQDNTTVLTTFSDQTTIPNGFNKTWVKATDPAGKMRRQVMDPLGRIVRLDEPDSNGNLGDVDANLPQQQTQYEYDGNDNLVKVTQSDGTTTQERLFKYDALSRLTHEKQVEADATLNESGVKVTSGGLWTKYLAYRADGLLDHGVDARGVTTTFSYDTLNRVSSVAYSGETGYQTPDVTYTYDQARSGHYNNGTLTRVETIDGSTSVTAAEYDYDNMGRIVKHRQSIHGQQYDLEYGYNLAGQLTSEKYPSGRVVTNSYDTKGRLASIADDSRTYLSDLAYQGKGGSLSSMRFGNGTVQDLTLNDRLQIANQTLTKNSAVVQKYDYGYGQIDANGDLDTTKNNGQLGKIESYIGANKQWTQKFRYDHIGRLKQSEERRGDTNALSYKQVFDFDRYGNMYRKSANNGTSGQANPLPYTPIEETTTPGTGHIEKQTNRFRTGTTYDEAGNVTVDSRFRDQRYYYDANGRMVQAGSTMVEIPDSHSVYDAAGQRVATFNEGIVWTFFIYDAFGRMVAEYGGMTAVDECGVKYMLSDWQGSNRAVVSNAGFVLARNDYTAYGEEIQSDTGLRTMAQGFGSNLTPRQKYGLTERDQPTGLDHTWFRKHENRAGRWTSPDPYRGSMTITDPQSFNRFAYVSGQPTNFIDPSGLKYVWVCQLWHRVYVGGPDGGQHVPGSDYWVCVWAWQPDAGATLAVVEVSGSDTQTPAPCPESPSILGAINDSVGGAGGVGPRTTRAFFRTVGSAAGSAGGAYVGAAVGFAIGGPPGAIIGGTLGSTAGGAAGSHIANEITHGIQDRNLPRGVRSCP